MNLARGLVARWWRTLGKVQIVGDGKRVEDDGEEEGLRPAGFISGRRPGGGGCWPDAQSNLPLLPWGNLKQGALSVYSRQPRPNPIIIQHILVLGDTQHYGSDGA